MVRVLGGAFLLVHAIITGAVWIPPQRGGDLKGFGGQANWLFAESRPAMVALGTTASVAFFAAGVAVLGHQGSWASLAAIGAVVSLALIVATFTPWWSAAIVINAVVAYLAWSSLTPELSRGWP